MTKFLGWFWDSHFQSITALFQDPEASTTGYFAYTHVGQHGEAIPGRHIGKRVKRAQAEKLDPATVHEVSEMYGGVPGVLARGQKGRRNPTPRGRKGYSGNNPASRHLYEVVVGNIGTVYTGGSKKEAEEHYSAYVKQSKAGRGRAAGEAVTLFEDGEIRREHLGRQGSYDDNPERTFEDWMRAVDAHVTRRTGLSVHDLPDAPYRDWYEDGVSPSSAAARAVRAAKGEMGLNPADDNPRKAHEDIVSAFFDHRKKRIGRRYATDGTSLWVWGNLVAQHQPEGLFLSDAGYQTSLTKGVLNQVLRTGESRGFEPGHIYQKDFGWYISTRVGEAPWPGEVVIPPAAGVPR